MLTAENISKSFDGREVLHHISLNLENGHIFGLLGTNGAGKSTLMRVISGIYFPDGGRVTLDGHNVHTDMAAKGRICCLSDDPTFLHGATIRDMAKYQAAFYPEQDNKRLEELCGRFSLKMDERISSMSKGTKKRVQVCLSLSRRPDVLLCDETFDGLDPVMREAFRKVISQETWDRGMVTVLAGHNQQEMSDICDSVGFLHEGELTTVGDIDTVVSGLHKVQFAMEDPVNDEVFASLEPLRVQRQGRLCVLTVRGDRERTRRVLEACDPVFLEMLPLSLEEVFILEMEEKGYAQER